MRTASTAQSLIRHLRQIYSPALQPASLPARASRLALAVWSGHTARCDRPHAHRSRAIGSCRHFPGSPCLSRRKSPACARQTAARAGSDWPIQEDPADYAIERFCWNSRPMAGMSMIAVGPENLNRLERLEPHHSRIERPNRKSYQRRTDQAPQDYEGHALQPIRQPRSPRIPYSGSLACPADIFLISVLVAILARHGRTASRTRLQHETPVDSELMPTLAAPYPWTGLDAGTNLVPQSSWRVICSRPTTWPSPEKSKRPLPIR